MVLSNVRHIVGEAELNEFRESVKRQKEFLDTEIDRLKPSHSIQDFGSLFVTILSFISIFSINKDIFLQYWIQAMLFFLIYVKCMRGIEYHFKLNKTRLNKESFHDERQLSIAYFLSLKSLVMNLKYNDKALAIMWSIAFGILIYNFFEGDTPTNLYLIILFGSISILSIILMHYIDILYDLFLWINTTVITPLDSLLYTQDSDATGLIQKFHVKGFSEITKSQTFFGLGLIFKDLLVLITMGIVIIDLIKNVSWDVAKDIFVLCVFQILTYVTISSFLSYKKIEGILETQRIMVIKTETFLEKGNIDNIDLASAKNYLKLSKLFLARKQIFATFFSWVEVTPNGELNIEENYNLLSNELGLPIKEENIKLSSAPLID